MEKTAAGISATVFLLFTVVFRRSFRGTANRIEAGKKQGAREVRKELEYPFDAEDLLRRKKGLRRMLLADGSARLKKRVAVLGGSTTHDVVKMLELFLLNGGIEPEFYESEYNRFYEDAVFGREELDRFCPDIIYIHTTMRNVEESLFPQMSDTAEQVEEKLEKVYRRFEQAWESLERRFHCPIIQNNFDLPPYRLLGNMDAWDHRGREYFLERLNLRFARYAQSHEELLIQDIAWLAADFGLGRWNDPVYWHMYRYSPAVPAIPSLAFNLANIIKAIYGKNRKALALDLDNTLWGGVVGDDGPENIEVGQETGIARIYEEFQRYVKAHGERGILLAVDSKNQRENALAGLDRPDGVLKAKDFAAIWANWEPKDDNLRQIARELGLGTDALVFVDDNPAERHRVSGQMPEVAVPEMTQGQEPQPERYIRVLDRSGYFEPARLSGEDLHRSAMYRDNARRRQAETSFGNYEEYLASLEMAAEIRPYAPEYMQRIAQLTNKSNQFNLTTKRCSQGELEAYRADRRYLTLYGRLKDRFGDNGVVSVVLGRQDGSELHLELWLMSCRVLRRDMEKAMMDQVVCQAKERGVEVVLGYYYPTPKNGMVQDFYQDMGFSLLRRDKEGKSVWKLAVKGYVLQNKVIRVNPDR